jgi:tRNA(Leu) C34 or U34 (ribose-2'-O)-methylase TrmL
MIILINPKYPDNLGKIVRIAAAFNVNQIFYTGTRLDRALSSMDRIPRELRMKEYKHIVRTNHSRPFDYLANDHTPIAVEVLDNAESIYEFEHPENAAYIFGPEDGSIPSHILRLCHRFVTIPTFNCLNLATAVAITIAGRGYKNDHVM